MPAKKFLQKVYFFIFAMAVTIVPANSQSYYIGNPLAYQIYKIEQSIAAMSGLKGSFTVKIQEARTTYFTALKNGANVQATGEAFSNLLKGKDYNYLRVRLVNHFSNINSIF